MCPVTRTVFKGKVEIAVLRPTYEDLMLRIVHSVLTFAAFFLSGRVVTMDCVNRIVRPEMRDPISGEPLTEADIIPIKGVCSWAWEAKMIAPIVKLAFLFHRAPPASPALASLSWPSSTRPRWWHRRLRE